MRLDLHCHSTCSDGSFAPAEVAAMAQKRGVELFCLTDHDTTAGFEETQRSLPGVRVLKGLELSCRVGRRTLHLLVYNIQPGAGAEALQSRLKQIEITRRERIEQILDKLDALGFVLDRATIRARGHGRTPGRPDVAAALVEAGICNSMRQAFDRFLKDDGPAYVAVDRLTLAEGLALGRAAGAKMSMAHPHSLRNYALVEDLFIRFKSKGLEGLEAHYGPYGSAEREHWGRLARKHDLVITAGSDFHGVANPRISVPGVDLEAALAQRLCDWLSPT